MDGNASDIPSDTDESVVEPTTSTHRTDTEFTKTSTIRKLTRSMVDLRSSMADDDAGLEMASAELEMNASNSSDDLYANSSTCSSAKHRIKDPITVAMALAYKLTSDEWLWEKVSKI